jgi:spore coat protein H
MRTTLIYSIKQIKLIWYLILSLFLVSSALAQDPGDQVFNDVQIFDFRFHFNQANFLDALYQSHKDGEYIPSIVEVNGVKYDSVGVRFKGTSSFYAYPGNKKSFRIKFDKYIEYRFDGLKKINLNNGWNDPTMLREKLFLDFLHKQSIPAPRANFARVYIDSTYWGFYTLVEHVDKTFLKDRFGNNDGNLYKAEVAPLTWQGENQQNYYDDFELKTNEKENDWSGLVDLIAKINNSIDFETEIKTVLNVDSHLWAWAANNLFVNPDSYLGSGTNYYLYQNEADQRFEWIIWDVNLSFGARNGKDSLDLFYAPADRPLHTNLLQSTDFRLQYTDVVEHLLNSGFDEETLYPRIDELWEFIREDYFQDTLKMYTNDEAEICLMEDLSNVPGLKPFIKKRRENVLNQLLQTNLVSDSQPKLTGFFLRQNYPNPFNPKTIISYQLVVNSSVELSIFNLLGQKVATLVSEKQKAGAHELVWNASNFSSGVYFYHLQTDQGFSQTRKLVLMQ